MSKNEKEQFWKNKYDDFIASGLKSSHWCKENNIPISTFTKWKKQFGDVKPKKTKFASVSMCKSSDNKKPLIKGSTLNISIGNATIAFHDDTSQEMLSKAVEVLIKYV